MKLPSSRAASLTLTLGTAGAAVMAATGFFGCGSESRSVFEPPVTANETQDASSVPPGTFPAPVVEPAFQKAPVLDGDNVPANVADLFAAATGADTGGPCLLEPEAGAMYPKNWLRPRFRWVKAGTQNLFEIRVHADNQANDLLVYTTNERWTMPAAMWEGLRNQSAGVPMTVTVRAGTFDNGALTNVSLGSTGPISIAPVEAPGTIVYWTGGAATPGGGESYVPALKGFRIGDETVRSVLTPAQVGSVGGTDTKCLGCHNSTPDGLFAGITARDHNPGGGPSRIALRAIDGSGRAAPISASAQNLFNRTDQEFPVFSKAFYTAGNRIAVTTLRLGAASGFSLAWTNLDATNEVQGTAWGFIQRNGDTRNAALPTWSHDGQRLIYISTPITDSGAIIDSGELYTVPFAGGAGGNATPLTGANDASKRQYYPSFSPDDKFVIFNRSTKTAVSSYDDPNGEIFVVPSAGGTATPLVANNPPACWPSKSPGIHNAWPKWSPAVRSAGGKDYYFVVFSSSRSFTKPAPRFHSRLYVTAIVVEGTNVTTYPALYLWNQPELDDNHSPAWDEFKIPDVK